MRLRSFCAKHTAHAFDFLGGFCSAFRAAVLCFKCFFTLHNFLEFQTLVQHLGPDKGLQPPSGKGSSLIKKEQAALYSSRDNSSTFRFCGLGFKDFGFALFQLFGARGILGSIEILFSTVLANCRVKRAERICLPQNFPKAKLGVCGLK